MKSFNVLNSTKNTIVATKVSRYTVYLLALVTVGVLALVVFGVKAWAQTVPAGDRNKVTMTLTQSANPGADVWARSSALGQITSRASGTTAQQAAWDAAIISPNLYRSQLRINLKLPTGYIFTDEDGNTGSGNARGENAEYKVKAVASRSACNAFDNDGAKSTTFGSTSDAFFARHLQSGTRLAHYRISGSTSSTSAEYMINQDHDLSETYAITVNWNTRSAAGNYACVEAIYKKPGNDNDPIFHYIAQPFTPNTGSVRPNIENINMSVPNDPVKIGDTATIRVRFNRAVKLLPIRNVSSALKGKLPYIRMKSNTATATPNPTYQDTWRFTMARVPSSSSNVLEFKRVIQFGDDVISDSDNAYQLLDNHLSDGNATKIHLGGYYIADAATGYLPITGSAGANRTTVIRKRAYANPQTRGAATAGLSTGAVSSASNTPDYYLQVDSTRLLSDFEIDIDTTPTLSVSRSGRNLIAKATPSSYRSGRTMDTVDNNSWYVQTFTATSTAARPTTTKCAEDTGDTYSGTITHRGNDDDYTRGQARITLPSTADNKWYCFGAEDSTSRDRAIATTWWRYVPDSTAPALTFSVANNRVTITSSDGGSGIADNSFGWFLMSSATAPCLPEQAASLFNNDSTTIAVRAPGVANTNHGFYICVRVADNAGNVKVQKYQLTRTATTTGTTTTPTTTPTTTTEEKPTTEAETTTTTTTDTPVANTAFLPANWGTLTTEQRVAHWASNKASFDTAWAALSTAQKIALNPYGCVVTQVRADNARCTQGSEGSVTFTGAASGTPAGSTTVATTTTAETTVEEETVEEEATEEEATDEEATDGEEVATDEATGDTTPAATTDTTTDTTTEESSSNTTTIIMIVAAVVVVVIIIVVVMSGRRGNSL